MVLRHPASISLVLVAALTAGTGALWNASSRTQPRSKLARTCGAQLPTGAESDVLEESGLAAVNYAVSTTPDGGTASWGANTNGHQATFTVTNTGICNDTYSFSATGNHGITGISLNKTSQLVNAGQFTTVVATYNVTTPGLDTLTLTAFGNTGGESDNGWFGVTVISYGVAVTPDAQPINAAAGTAQSLVFQVQNTGSTANTYTMTCSVTGSETCGTVVPSTLTNLAAGASAPDTVHFTAGAVGTSGTVTLSASGSGGATDNGSYSITNATFSVAVSPDARPRSVDASTSLTLTYEVRNTGTVNDTYALTCVVAGSETCGVVSPTSIANMLPGIAYPATVTFTAGAAGTSGTVTLHAARTGGYGAASDDGSFSVTNATAVVAVSPHGQALSVTANSSKAATFSLQNPGSSLASYRLTCAVTGNESCGTVTPSQISVAPGAAGPVTVNFSAGAVGTGTVTLHAAGIQGGTDDGTFAVTNTAPPPIYGVAVTPDGITNQVRFASPQSTAFVVQNTGTATDTYHLACDSGGAEKCDSIGALSDTVITVAAGASAAVTANFVSGKVDTSGTILLRATGSAGVADQGYYNFTNISPPAEQCTALLNVRTPDYGADPDVIASIRSLATVCPPVYVWSWSSSASWQANSSGHTALFSVQDTSGAPSGGYDLSCSGTGPVTCASVSSTSISLSAGSTTTIVVTYSVGAAGTGTLTFTATSQNNANVHPSASVNVTSVAPTYGVAVTPDGQATNVDVQSAQTATFQVQGTGTGVETYTLTCVTTGNETCGSITPSTVTGSAAVAVSYIAGAVGSGTVKLRAVGSGGSSDSGTYNVKNTYFAAVTPKGAPVARLNAHAYADTFVVRNPGINQATYSLTATCSGTGIASGCTPSVTSLTLADGDSSKVNISYTTGAAGTTGQVKLIATASADATSKDSGWTSVSVGTTVAPVVDVASVNPGTTRERGLCLMFAAGGGAATECGDLRVVHPLPATRTLNKARAPTLLYNSAEARPYPLVAANVTLPITAATPDTVSATLKIGGVVRGTTKWLGTDWTPGSTRRVVIADTLASDSTKIYSYTLTVTNQWNGVSVLTSPAATVQVAVVSRKLSPFGAGWWLAGIERLYTDSMLWVGGDGSTRKYTPAGTNVWTAPNMDRPDTLKKDPVLNQYTRYLAHGVRVVFDAQGHHMYTIDRLSDTTKFTWGTGDTLQTIKLPPAGLTYQFTYTNGSRWVVTAPSIPGQTRADTGTVSSGHLTMLRGPDTTRVTFGYSAGTDANLIISRTDRLGNATTYAYDGGRRLVQSQRPDIGLTQWQPLETVGYPPSGAGHAADTAVAYAHYDGPRTDVWDTSAIWLDRFGAPRRVVNALGYQTVITRDTVWPALAKQVQGPTGLVTTAAYNARGTPDSVTQVNPLGDGRNAVTRYTWDAKWDFVRTTTLPTGEVSQFAYDTGNGNRLWQQPGLDSTRRVRFFYTNDAFHQLQSVQYPTSPITSDSTFYDPTLRNLSATKTPLGFVSSYFKDAIGRDTLTQTVDASTVSVRTVYDITGQDTLNVTSPGDGSATVTVRKHYDVGGNQDSVQTISTPDSAHIGWVQHVFTYDRAYRKVTERLLGPGTNTIPFRYDPSSNLTNGGRQGGDNVTLTYDALNHMILRTDTAHDTASFSYDTLGNLRTANNVNAQIVRRYFPNGALRYDTLRLSTDFLPAHDFTQHIYAQEFRYDLDARRVWAKHPAQLSPGADTVTYSYDSIFGQLKGLTDVFGNRYAFTFDSLGRPRRVTRSPQGQDSLVETIAYDNDGRLSSRSVQTSTIQVLSENLTYTGAGTRVLSALHTDIQSPPGGFTDQFTYSGLGAVTNSGLPPGPENYRSDALGNRVYDDHGDGTQPDNTAYVAGTGRSAFREEIRHPPPRGTGKDTTFYTYDLDGQLWYSDHRHYWTATMGTDSTASAGVENDYITSTYNYERQLTKTQFRQDSSPPFRSNYQDYISEEYYRYDALGRRVYTRNVRGPDCARHDVGSGCLSYLTRTVWDGSQILYEVRVPGDTGATLETDSPGSDSTHGIVGFLHAAGIDQPLALWKSDSLVLPFSDYRGAFITGTCPTALCNVAFFPAGQWTSFGDPPPYPHGIPFWHGSLIDGGRDASGYQYKRNRYYDPNGGRFTQEDPIGLAGGLNLYGFANGDPVNFTDPFGLCPPTNTSVADCDKKTTLGNAWIALDGAGSAGKDVISGIVNAGLSVGTGDTKSCGSHHACTNGGKTAITLNKKDNAGTMAVALAHEYQHTTEPQLTTGTPDQMAGEAANNELSAWDASTPVYDNLQEPYKSQAAKIGADIQALKIPENRALNVAKWKQNALDAYNKH